VCLQSDPVFIGRVFLILFNLVKYEGHRDRYIIIFSSTLSYHDLKEQRRKCDGIDNHFTG
ncbi:hypothetical protein V8V75_24310, partial [Peribacillus frigoritolerans]|uniref:hypothetical protein n=1 Tax=Peribacillus frigoritolerans TaxID=450367 RepID=UPI00300ACFB5